MIIHAGNYFPRPPSQEASVQIEVELDTEEVDRSKKIPQWGYHVGLKFIDGSNRAISGTLAATDEDDAIKAVQSKAIEFLCEVLAEYVKRQHTIDGIKR